MLPTHHHHSTTIGTAHLFAHCARNLSLSFHIHRAICLSTLDRSPPSTAEVVGVLMGRAVAVRAGEGVMLGSAPAATAGVVGGAGAEPGPVVACRRSVPSVGMP